MYCNHRESLLGWELIDTNSSVTKKMYHKVPDSLQHSSNIHPQDFQYRIQLCGTPEQTISHSQLFSSLETIGKQISNVNMRECLDIFGCVVCAYKGRDTHTHTHAPL